MLVIALAGNAYLLYLTILFFMGGQVWPLSWEAPGGVGPGLVFLLFGAPIAEAVVFFVASLLAAPFAMAEANK